VSELASQLAAMPAVRRALLQFQRQFAHSPPGCKKGAVLDGRDIGTVVCPDADVKLFVTASIEERAARRYKELLARGEASIYAQILQDMEKRDARDSGRATAPLKPAKDALVLDTTNLDPDAVFKAALILISKRNRAAGGE
jgi:cytidylate kinase